MKKGYESIESSLSNECKIFDQDAVSICYGYRKSIPKTLLYYFLGLCSVGLLFLISYWKPNFALYLTHRKCCLCMATRVLLIDQFGVVFVEKVKTANYPLHYSLGQKHLKSGELKMKTFRSFCHKHLKYFYDSRSECFLSTENVNEKETFYDLNAKTNGLDTKTRDDLLSWFGPNKIDVEVKSYLFLFFEECADPFYIFQVFSCILWFSDNYYYYSAAIVFISVSSIIISIYQTRQHLKTLHNMIAKSSKVQVLSTNNTIIELSSEELVPGDILVIPKHGGTLPCDAVLLSGTVIVNESMLTGESLPITKTPINVPSSIDDVHNEIYHSLKHKRNTLFCGTDVLQTRFYGNENVCAAVVKTGFNTMKGDLIRSILFPKPVDFQFFNDAMKFIGVLAIFALIGLIYTIYCFMRDGADVADIIKKSLDVITIAVPPALPAAMSVGTVYALQRLKKRHIFCISPSRVNISGKIKLFCFDKTGTLTEDGLDFCGVIRSTGNTFENLKSEIKYDSVDNMIVGMATCHSLTILDNKITGDPLDEKMFFSTDWDIEEAGTSETERYGNIVPTIVRPKISGADSVRMKYTEDQALPLEIAILKQFTFSSELQRMSVIVRKLGAKSMDVFVKGSPEMIASLSIVSTIPANYEETLMYYTKQGYRVIALAYKPLSRKVQWHKIQHFQRIQAESELNFLGFIVLKNVLKPETTPIIHQLYKAHIRPVMVTGDNILTAVSVARECGIVKPCEKIVSITLVDNPTETKLHFSVIGELDHHIDIDSSNENDFITYDFLQRNYHLAVTGKVFAVILSQYPRLFQRLMVCGTIFARMLPDQKTALIEGLQKLGYGVGMCGDGANDCGALKRAHAGISLSEAEASVASPFTSKIPNISCVIEVIKEGRCALVTSFNIFKYMALYSMIQYSSVLLLYNISSNLGDLQYLYIDLFIIMPLAITMSRTGPSNKLHSQRPLGRLVHPVVLFSIIMQVFTQTAFQVFIYFYVPMLPSYQNIDHFKSKTWHPGVAQICAFENTGIFILTAFQYIIVAIVFSVGRPHRKEFFTNKAFVCVLIFFTMLNCIIGIKPCSFLQKQFQVLSIKEGNYYFTLFGIVACNFMVTFIIDNILLQSKYVCKILKKLQFKTQPRNKYKLILKELEKDVNWPMMKSYKEDQDVVC